MLPLLLLAVQDMRPQDVDARAATELLARRCFACHGPDEEGRKAELRLDTQDGAAAVLEHELLARVTATDDTRMPPEEVGDALSSEDIELLRRWIDGGADFPRHWSFVPPERPALPENVLMEWPREDLDRFILARLERVGLDPSPEADRRTLARRLSLDLIGLPPTPEQVEALVADPSEAALERYVDELLASPHYGEHWARLWLDVARYADSAGYGSDPLRTIWRYRDWVIDSFNQNQPFDEFTLEQLAGDLLPNPTVEQRLATAFHRNTKTNTEGGTDDEEFRVEAVKDRIDTTMQAWMGLTFGCAKCHTHKYDPITIDEYYSGFAVFNQTADTDRNNDAPRLRTPSKEEAQSLAKLEADIASLEERLAQPLDREQQEAARAQLAARLNSWRSLAPLAVEAATTMTVDGVTVVATSPVDRDRYEVEFELPAGRWTGLRIDALPDPNLPSTGPGLSPGNGNFVLSNLTLERVPSGAPAPITGRFVRLELSGEGRILSVAEVQAFAGGFLHKPAGATQSSVGYNGPAKLAIDGNTSGIYTDGSVTHTATEKDPWFELDLGQERPIDQVHFWNRADGDLYKRLDGVRVSVLNDAREVQWSGRVAKTQKLDTIVDLQKLTAEVPFGAPSASFEQEGWTVASALDEDSQGSGWGISPRFGERHHAVFPLQSPLNLDEPARLRLKMEQGFGTSHLIGRFELFATEFEGEVSTPSAEVLAAQAAAPDCTNEELAILETYLRGQHPERLEAAKELEELQAKLAAAPSVTTPVMEELPPDRQRTTHVLERGNFLQKGHEVQAGVPAAFAPWPEGQPKNRLGFAHWLLAEENPLTARVTVNRFWMSFFGTGLVETQEDFGRQGARPSHPELLDYLAVEFRESGWDTKALLKRLVLSATYRQSSVVSEASLAGDPDGRLLSRMPRVPLSAEQVRDQALFVSGQLSTKMHGPSVFPPQPDGLWQAAFNGQRSWKTSEGEDRYRRALYVFWRRTSPYPSLETFDAPSRETCTLRRVRTNTPLQAFVTLNDPVFVECAQALAGRMEGEGSDAIRSAFRLCLQREPTGEELRRLTELYVDTLTELATLDVAESEAIAGPTAGDVRQAAARTVVASVLLNLDEFLNRE